MEWKERFDKAVEQVGEFKKQLEHMDINVLKLRLEEKYPERKCFVTELGEERSKFVKTTSETSFLRWDY